MNKLMLMLICMLAWIYLLYVLKKEKLTAFYFMIGSAGLFCFCFFSFKSILSKYLSMILAFLLDIINDFINIYEVYSNYNIIFINHNDAAISLFIDYECCGVIEILVLLSIVLFFPLFDMKEKILYSIIGILYTMFSNIIRLLSIVTIIYFYGNDVYYIAHSIIGRIIFYVLTLFLYFYIITIKQIKEQKVGNFDYE